MDGLNFKVSGNLLDTYFKQDRFGSFIPDRSLLPMELVGEKVKKQLNAKSGLYTRLATIYERTDVQFTDNPLGNTPVLGVGFKKFGKRPLNLKRAAKLDRLVAGKADATAALEKREKKIEENQKVLMKLHSDLEPTLKSDRDRLLWQVEQDQVMTGGGFDNNAIGEVQKSALNFVIDSSAQIDYENTELSQAIVDGSLWVKEHLIKEGLVPGTLGPTGASVVRAEQDTDGMFGWPVYCKGNDALDADISLRLLVESGVDTSKFVGTKVKDTTTKLEHQYRVIDAGGFILDNKIFSANDMVSLVTLLARIQKHGWTGDIDKLEAKPGKTRSVYPNAFLPALIEGMIVNSFNNKLKEIKSSILPSVQDKPTRVEMIKKQILEALDNGYDYLAADWSKYDASVKGSILATIMQLVVKPFYRAEYHSWIDAATFILTYKYIITNTNLCKINPDMYDQAKQTASHIEVKDYTIFGLVDGLISGAKFTHVGGSLYGEVVVHYGIGAISGWKPIIGAQAGDDTLMGVPLDRIDISSIDATYNPIFDVAERFGLHANVSKQIWHQSKGEIVKVFLQDSFHAAEEVWGVGSIFRPVSALWFTERDKGLSIAEQLMAEIARMNQGADSPFVTPVTAWWLSQERYLGWLFKEYGVSASQQLVDSVGKSYDQLFQSLDIGSFTYGVSRSDMEANALPIYPVMADASANMTFSSEDRASFLGDLNQENQEVDDPYEETPAVISTI